MPFYDTTWYTNSVGYSAVAAWAATTAIVAGALRRQLAAPAVNSERVFICIVAGTTGGSEPTWVLTRGTKTTDGTVTWMEVSGIAAVNGDKTNTVNWTAAKAIGVPTLGATIQRNNGASYWICTTAGTMGASEPAWPNDTAGTTQADGTTTWTCLGVVGNFTGGQAPHARITNAATLNWFAAGNTIYVGDNHAESQATAITIGPAAATTSNATGRILCHNHSGSYPPAAIDLTTGASVSNTSNVAININVATALYVYGLTFKTGVGASAGGSTLNLGANVTGAGQNWYYFDNCSFWLSNTASGSNISLGGNNNSTFIVFNNCTVKFASVGSVILLSSCADFTWQNTGPVLVSGSVVPAALFGVSASIGNITLEAVDLSQITGNIISVQAVSNYGKHLFKDCKLNASAAIISPINTGVIIQLVRSASGAVPYRSDRYEYEGTETTETSITRVGGASDPTGQAQSRKIVTTANSQWLRPFKAEPYAQWNPTTGANVTVTVCGTINAGALPNNDDIWLEVEYLGSSLTPLGTIVTTTKANVLAANAAVAADGSTWNGGGSGAGWSPFRLTATLSSPQPGMAGYIHVRVRAAKPSMTVYIDPQITLS